MKDDKLLADSALSDSALEKVTGGTGDFEENTPLEVDLPWWWGDNNPINNNPSNNNPINNNPSNSNPFETEGNPLFDDEGVSAW